MRLIRPLYLKSQKLLGFMSMPQLFLFGISTSLLVIFVTIYFSIMPAQAATVFINTTDTAVQTPYLSGVPHFDNDGNLRTTYDPNSSFFPNGFFWLSDTQSDENIVPVLTNAGFNVGVNTYLQDPQFYINQITGPNQFFVGIATNNPFTLLASQTTTASSATLSGPNLAPNTTYPYFVCSTTCAKVAAKGSVTTNAQGEASISWDDGSNFKLIINNRMKIDANAHFDPTTFIESVFTTYKDNENVFGWWVVDEPLNVSNFAGVDPQINLDIVNGVFNQYEPQTEQLMILTESFRSFGPFWDEFVNIGGIGNVYQYNKFFSNLPLSSFEETANANTQMVQAVGEQKPSWFIPQLYYGSLEGSQYLTPQEERAQVYTSLIHGATGLIHFAWDSCDVRNHSQNIKLAGVRPNVQSIYPECDPDSLPLDPAQVDAANALWNALSAQEDGINKEIQDLTPILYSNTVDLPYSVFVDQTPISAAPIRTLLKEYNGDFYLLTVNIDNAPIAAQFHLDSNVIGPTKLFETHNVAASNNVIHEEFDPFEVNIYKFQLEGEAGGAVDTDSDGFTDAVEVAIGTDPNSSCSLTSGTDAFPPDINADGIVNIVNDIIPTASHFGAKSTDSDWQQTRRYDMNGDTEVTIADILLVASHFSVVACT